VRACACWQHQLLLAALPPLPSLALSQSRSCTARESPAVEARCPTLGEKAMHPPAHLAGSRLALRCAVLCADAKAGAAEALEVERQAKIHEKPPPTELSSCGKE
jgi:hypothetical protein